MTKAAFRRHWAGCTAALLIVVAALPCCAEAAAGTRDARLLVQHLGAQAIDALGPSTPTARRIALFRELLNKDFDLADTARFALGPYARSLTRSQQRQFMTLYREVLADVYADRLSQYAGAPFRVTGERQIGDMTMVSSEVVRPRGPPVKIDWQIAHRSGRLLITDVFVDGVSQRLAQREEFIGIIRRNGGQPGAVIAALRQRLQQEE